MAPYVNPFRWWFISWLGLIFPFLLLLLIVSVFFWTFFKPKYALIFFIVLLLGWKSISVFFAFHIPREFNYDKKPGSIRIVTWNVARFVEIMKNNNKGSQTRLKMMDLLKQQNADILCLQEFHTATRPDYYDNITYIQKELNYPYHYFSWDEDGVGIFYSSIIFSRIPIIDSGRTKFPQPALPESLLYADIKAGDDTVRIFTSHLQSVRFNKLDYDRIDRIKNYKDSIIPNSKNIFSKVRIGITYRSVQADLIKRMMNQSPHPVILCADFNDVPNSYTYFTVRGDLQDAFLLKGSGIGRTFTAISPTLRIDYILASDELSVLQFNRVTKKYSDHYMLVADLKPKDFQQ
jgi:endonuclease/exonuclease/phosphatase family metal-dependent hydrolase